MFWINADNENNTKPDTLKGIQILIKLAYIDCDSAIMKLYNLYQDGIFSEFPELKEFKFDSMIIYLTKAANRNNIEALNTLGLIYQYGEEAEKDLNKSKALFEKSLFLGNVDSAFNLFEIYKIEKNIQKANEFFELGLDSIEVNKFGGFKCLDKIPKLSKKDIENKHYLIINKKVYNVSEYMKKHPGGKEILMGLIGEDATEDFYEYTRIKQKRY